MKRKVHKLETVELKFTARHYSTLCHPRNWTWLRDDVHAHKTWRRVTCLNCLRRKGKG